MSDINKQSLHDRIKKKYENENRICSVIYEVTHKCPCDCIHCYLLKKPENELTIDEIENLFKQLHKEGVIELVLTGGEPFIRKDFSKILKAASEHSFFTTILTTGILIQNAEVKLLQKYRMKKIELSILGAGPETHDAIMRFPGAFNRLIKVVKLLKKADMLIALKATIMEKNWKELDAMSQIAKKFDVAFTTSMHMSSRENGDKAPLNLAIPPDKIKYLNPELIGFIPISGDDLIVKNSLLCSAGTTVAAISSSGDIFPCVLLREKLGNIRDESIEQIWHRNSSPFLAELRNLDESDFKECILCDYIDICPRCIGISYMESKNITKPPSTTCIIAREIFNLNKNK